MPESFDSRTEWANPNSSGVASRVFIPDFALVCSSKISNSRLANAHCPALLVRRGVHLSLHRSCNPFTRTQCYPTVRVGEGARSCSEGTTFVNSNPEVKGFSYGLGIRGIPTSTMLPYIVTVSSRECYTVYAMVSNAPSTTPGGTTTCVMVPFGAVACSVVPGSAPGGTTSANVSCCAECDGGATSSTSLRGAPARASSELDVGGARAQHTHRAICSSLHQISKFAGTSNVLMQKR